jgi:hypothetical protein
MNTEEILSTFARFAYDELGTDMDAIDALQNDIERLKAGQLTFKPLIKQLISLCNEYELKETYNIVMSFHSKPKVNETLDFARWKMLKESGIYTVDRAINDYTAEVDSAHKMKKDGTKEVSGRVAGEELADGRTSVPIDEYIRYWENGLKKLKKMRDDGETDASEFNY